MLLLWVLFLRIILIGYSNWSCCNFLSQLLRIGLLLLLYLNAVVCSSQNNPIPIGVCCCDISSPGQSFWILLFLLLFPLFNDVSGLIIVDPGCTAYGTCCLFWLLNIVWNATIISFCLSFLFCCFYCSNHDDVVAIVLHFRFLLLLLLFAKQPIKTERYRTLHLPSLLLSSLSLLQYCCCCCSWFPILMVLFLLLFATKNRYNLKIPSIAYPFLLPSSWPTSSITSFSNLLSFYDDKPHWIPCVINCYCCYQYYYFALLSDPN